MNRSKELGGATVAPAAVSGAHGNPYPVLPQTVPAVLRAAADLIEPKGAWTRFTLARRKGNLRGKITTPDDPQATCWCVEGAIMRFTGGYTRDYWTATEALTAATGFAHFGPAEFNDAKGRTQAECVAALRKAAALADGTSTRQAPDASQANVLNPPKSGAS